MTELFAIRAGATWFLATKKDATAWGRLAEIHTGPQWCEYGTSGWLGPVGCEDEWVRLAEIEE